MLRLQLPPRGALAPNSDVDPLKYYYVPLLGRVFRARLDVGLGLLRPPHGGRFRRLLEVGYGSGLLLPTLRAVAERLDGIDLESRPDVVRAALARLGVTVDDLRQADVCSLPFENGRFDAVVAFSILEHLRAAPLRTALGEMARVLSPGGQLLVGCPAVHRGMSLAFAAIGFRGIDDHHFSGIRDVLAAARLVGLTVEKTATLPRGAPLGWAPYNAVLLRRE